MSNLRKFWYKGGQLLDYIRILGFVVFNLKRYDKYSIHATWDFTITVGLLIMMILRISGKKVSYHFFGGIFHELYLKLPGFYQKIVDRTIFKADVVWAETLRMKKAFSVKNDNIRWLPNCRKQLLTNIPRQKFEHKVVFLSRAFLTYHLRIRETFSFISIYNSVCLDVRT